MGKVRKKRKNENLSANMEDYLEAIAVLKRRKNVVRVKDISTLLSVSKPSVSGALIALARRNLIVHERYGYIELTDDGRVLAEHIIEKHDMLVKFFTQFLEISPEQAEKDACKIEHVLSQETYKKLTQYVQKQTLHT